MTCIRKKLKFDPYPDPDLCCVPCHQAARARVPSSSVYTKDSGISCPWIWLPYAETHKGPTVNSGTPALLKHCWLNRVVSEDGEAGSYSVLEHQADQLLAEHGLGEHGPSERRCELCGTVLEGRPDQKTCNPTCRKQMSREVKQVLDELVAMGVTDAYEKMETDQDFADMVRQTAIRKLPRSTGIAVDAAMPLEGYNAEDVSDDYLWIGEAPQPEHIVTGEYPAWQRVTRYDNAHHLRWPWRVRDKSLPWQPPVKPNPPPGHRDWLNKTGRPESAAHYLNMGGASNLKATRLVRADLVQDCWVCGLLPCPAGLYVRDLITRRQYWTIIWERYLPA